MKGWDGEGMGWGWDGMGWDGMVMVMVMGKVRYIYQLPTYIPTDLPTYLLTSLSPY